MAPPAPTPTPTNNAHAWALHALCLPDPEEKVRCVHALFAASQANGPGTAHLKPAEPLAAPPNAALPGRPAQPMLVPPMQVPHSSPFTVEGLAALVHAICHIEFNAIKTHFNEGTNCLNKKMSGKPPVPQNRSISSITSSLIF